MFTNLEPAFDIRVSPHRPDQHEEGTDTDLDKILHKIHKKLLKLKFEVVTTFRYQDMGLQNVQHQGQHQDFKGRD